MEQDLIITSIHNDHAKTVIARMISQRQSIPLQKALQLVQTPPFVFTFNATQEELKSCISQLSRLGVTYKTANSLKKTVENPEPIMVQNTVSTPNTVSKVAGNTERPKRIRHYATIEIPEPPQTKKSKPWISITAISLLLATPIILIIFFPKQKSSEFLSNYDGSVSDSLSAGGSENHEKNIPSKRKLSQATPDEKKMSNSYVDSAKIVTDDYNRTIKFYQLAISFNKYNYRAWYGLIDAYYNVHRDNDAHKAEKEMKNIFGASIFSLKEIIEPFGTITDAYLTEDNTYKIEYQSEANGKKALMNECFQIIRAFRPKCTANSISIFAAQTAGTGLIVHIQKNAVFTTTPEFEKAALITYLE